MLMKSLLIALWAGIAGVDHFNGLLHIHRPVFTGMVVGFILGDVKTGLVTGATLELVWMGAAPLAGAQPPNVVIGGIVGTAFAILSKSDPNVAVGIAVPFAVAVQAAITLIFTAFSPVMHKADEYAENADTRGIEQINYFGILIMFLFNAIIAFLPVYFGAEVAQNIVGKMPEWLIGGLEVAGGMMPAIGFAMLLKIMYKREYLSFLIIGFVLVAYFKLPILGVAFLGLAVALYDYNINKLKRRDSSRKEVYTNGI